MVFHCSALHELARCLRTQGKYRDSEGLFLRSLSINMANLSESDMNIAISNFFSSCGFASDIHQICFLARVTLAKCLIDQYRPKEAQSLLRQATAVSFESSNTFVKSLSEDGFLN